jgi:hypothetical protein
MDLSQLIIFKMGFDDLFDMKRMIMDKLSNNPQMKSLLIIAAVVIIVVLIILAIIVVPLLFKFVSYIGDQGIKGFLDAIWKGSK